MVIGDMDAKLKHPAPIDPPPSTLLEEIAASSTMMHTVVDQHDSDSSGSYEDTPRRMSVPRGSFVSTPRWQQRSVPVEKWNRELVESALDLFEGKALVWYRSVRALHRSWDSLATALRSEFQTPDHDELLLGEIRRRTQGPKETIGIYIAVMLNLFARLSVSLSENLKLSIIQRNLSPFFQTQLAFQTIESIDQLKALGKKLEFQRSIAEAYVPPPPKAKAMEADLAYVQVENISGVPTSAICSTASAPRPGITCYNCDQEGHIRSECRKPFRMKCFGCGNLNFTKRTCPRCSGNERSSPR